MIRPGYLRKGDTIGITAPAGSLKQNEIEKAVEIIRSWDLKVDFGKYIFRKKNSFAGSDDQRAEDLQKMLDDREIKAIICARGGYGTNRIIDRLIFREFVKYPKWLVGYSDITILHSALHNLGVESIHGAMPRFAEPKQPDLVSFETLRGLLFGELNEYRLKSHRLNRNGKGKGILTGGNLSVLYSMNATKFDISTKNKVLFIEDISEQLYHIDRMIMNLKLGGKLEDLAGLIVGDMTDMKSSSFRTPAYKIIRDAVAEYHYPVLFGFPGGHGKTNLALPMGRMVGMEVGKEGVVGWRK